MKTRILVVEDDQSISELICYNLQREGYETRPVLRGDAVGVAVVQFAPDLILLDLMLPGLDGLEVCRRLKQDPDRRKIPVIMLTAKGSESDIVTGLKYGADDYLAKPFSPKVLTARIAAVLRRSGGDGEVLGDLRVYGPLAIDMLKRKITLRGKVVVLTTLEFDIVEFLSRAPGRVFTREQLLDAVWKDGKFIVDRAVDVHVRGIRKKFGNDEDLIGTVRGVGYRFKESDDS
jgi:two-component system phosphate regulon response regulator PhoB